MEQKRQSYPVWRQYFLFNGSSLLINADGDLGEEYYVWDKEASINFIQPGKSDLFAKFEICQTVLDEIYSVTKRGEKCFPEFVIHVKDAQGNVVSEVQRKLYVRKKPQYREEVIVTN